jgi:hypothetical protein
MNLPNLWTISCTESEKRTLSAKVTIRDPRETHKVNVIAVYLRTIEKYGWYKEYECT